MGKFLIPFLIVSAPLLAEGAGTTSAGTSSARGTSTDTPSTSSELLSWEFRSDTGGKRGERDRDPIVSPKGELKTLSDDWDFRFKTHAKPSEWKQDLIPSAKEGLEAPVERKLSSKTHAKAGEWKRDPIASSKEEQETPVEARKPEPYLLQVGDSLRIALYGEHHTERVVKIDTHGTLSYLLVGSILAVGKTIDQVREELNERMKENFKFSLVTVVPVHFGGVHYTLAGQFASTGRKSLEGATRLLDAIGEGGGFKVGFFRHETTELADLEHAFLLRNGEYVPVDFEELVQKGNAKHNLRVWPGDLIYVPSYFNQSIYVLGEVNNPVNIGYQGSATLVGALAKGRGITSRAGRWVFIIRGSLSHPKVMEVKIKELFKGEVRNIVLKPGDIVYVPPRKAIYVEEILQGGLNRFVGTITRQMGESLFESTHPHAKLDDDDDDSASGF